MVFQRRQLLPSPSFPFGSSFILGRNQLGIGADRRTANDFLPPLLGPLFAMLQERNTGGSLSSRRAMRIPFGSKRPDPPFSIFNRRRATFSRGRKRPGC
jgi:hypothetical protein